MKSSSAQSDGASSKKNKFGAAVMSKCVKCSENIFSFDEITAINNTYHKKCFTCIDCKKQLLFDTFKVFEDQPYCSGCYYKYRQGGKISPRSGNSSPRPPKPQSSTSTTSVSIQPSSSSSSSVETNGKLVVDVSRTVININSDSVPSSSPSKNMVATSSPEKDTNSNASISPPKSPNKVGIRLASAAPKTPSLTKSTKPSTVEVLIPPAANASESEKIIYFLRSTAKPLVIQPSKSKLQQSSSAGFDESCMLDPVEISVESPVIIPSSSSSAPPSPFPNNFSPPLSPVTPNNASVKVQHKQLAQRNSTKLFVDEQLSMFYAYYKQDNINTENAVLSPTTSANNTNDNDSDHIPSPHSPVRNVRANPSKKGSSNLFNHNTDNNSDSDSVFERKNAELLEQEQIYYQQQFDLQALQESQEYENQLNFTDELSQEEADKEARELSVRLALFRQQEIIQDELELVKALHEKEAKEQAERIREEEERQLLLDQQAAVWAENVVSPRTNNELTRQPSQATMEIAKWRDKKKKLKQQKMEALKEQETVLEKMTVIQSKKRSNTILYMEMTGTVGTGSIYGNMYDSSRNTMLNSSRNNIHGSSTLRLVHNNNSHNPSNNNSPSRLHQSSANSPPKPAPKPSQYDLDDLLSSLDIQHVNDNEHHQQSMGSARVAEDMTVDSIEEEDEALCRALDEEALMLAELKKWEEQVNAELAEAEQQEQQAKLWEEQELLNMNNNKATANSVAATPAITSTNSKSSSTNSVSNNGNNPHHQVVAPSSPLRKGTLGGGNGTSSPVRSRSSSQMFDDKMRETKFKTSHAVHVGSVNSNNNSNNNNSNHNNNMSNSNHSSSCALDVLGKKDNSREGSPNGSPLKKNASNHMGNSSHSINSYDSGQGRDSNDGTGYGNHSPLNKKMSFQINNNTTPTRTGSNKFVNPMANRVNNFNTMHIHNDSATTVTTMRQTFSGGSHDDNDGSNIHENGIASTSNRKRMPPPPAASSSSSSAAPPKKGIGRLTNFVRSKLLGKEDASDNKKSSNNNDQHEEQEEQPSRPSLFSFLSPRSQTDDKDADAGRESESGGGNATTRQTFKGLFKRTKSKL